MLAIITVLLVRVNRFIVLKSLTHLMSAVYVLGAFRQFINTESCRIETNT